MPIRPQRRPPSAGKVFALGAVTLAAYGAYRLFIGQLLPSTAAFNLPPQDLAVGSGSLACALFLYWLGRLRYGRATLRNLPGSWTAGAAALLGLALAAACLQWPRPPAPWDAASALPRLAGLAAALSAAACEEIGFRGILSATLAEWAGRRGVMWGLLLGSLGFALLHWAYQSPWNLAFAAAAGLALGVARLRGASLFLLIAAHACMDAVDALWLSPSLSLGYWNGLAAAGVALVLGAALWLLPKAVRPPSAA